MTIPGLKPLQQLPPPDPDTFSFQEGVLMNVPLRILEAGFSSAPCNITRNYTYMNQKIHSLQLYVFMSVPYIPFVCFSNMDIYILICLIQNPYFQKVE